MSRLSDKKRENEQDQEREERMLKNLSLFIAFFMLAACATIARYSIEDSLKDIGIPAKTASCMGEQLKDRLSDDDLQTLADHLSTLSRSETAGGALDATLEIDNLTIVGAITASSISCAFAPK